MSTLENEVTKFAVGQNVTYVDRSLSGLGDDLPAGKGTVVEVDAGGLYNLYRVEIREKTNRVDEAHKGLYWVSELAIDETAGDSDGEQV